MMIFDLIESISKRVTILLIEQNANMAFSIAHRAYVLETGRIVISGSAQELAGIIVSRSAYLGC